MTQPEVRVPLVRFVREGHDLPDAFGAHTRLAKAMQVALLTNPTLEVVGLFGAWGSGKSKVMKLLEARMTTETTRFFTYDAWVHQSDSPRRAFLEALISFLEEEKLIDPEISKTTLAKLLKKTETVEIESQPEVSIRLGLVLSIMLLVPVASQFLRADWMKPVAGELTWWFLGRQYSPYFTVALYLTLLPSLALAAITSFRAIMHACGKTVGGGLTSLFVNKGKEVRRDQKRTDPEPTALEFQKFFRDLLAQVEATGGRQLIFVIDNLDRLPDHELMSLWSSIRSLFHGEDTNTKGKPPTLVLPLDFEAVERVYEAKDGVAQGFADKTFDVIFRVPPPVSSQWQDYLWTQINEVFGVNARPDWKKIAIRVLEEAEVDSRLPRAINIYVNELATLWLQWRDEDVSFAAIAYYAANRDAIDRNAWRSLQLQINWMTDFDPHWTRGVAALRFGAPPALASQILLEQPLREAITAFDASAFAGLSRHAGFGSVLRRSVEGYRTNTTSLPLANTARLLADLDGSADHNVGLAWACLADGLRSGAWDPRGEPGSRAFDLIIRNNPAGGRARARAAVRDRLEQWTAGDLASAVTPIVEILRLAAQSARDDASVFGRVTMPVDVAGALVFAEALGEDAGLINVRADPAALAADLIRKAIDEKSSRSLVAAVLAWQLPAVWGHLVGLAPGVVQKRNTEGAVGICLLLGEIWRAVPQARDELQRTLLEEPFVYHLAKVISVGDGASAGVMTALLMLPDAPEPRVGSMWEGNRKPSGFISSVDDHLTRFAPDLSVDDLLSRAIKVPEVKNLVQLVVARRGSARSGPSERMS